MCHYSGYSRRADTICELCGSDKLIVQGSGTQQIEEEVGQWFPGAKVLRFDKDSTTKKGAHERILTAFSRHEADILVGTQLVSKGLDFASVTVVGVIDADTEQAYPSFNSSERLYQLLSQVAGRSGRGDKAGKVFIQTRQSNNPAIQFAKMHDHKSFARQEMAFRKELNYPPYSRLVQFVFKGKEETRVRTAAQLMKQLVGRMLPTLEILGPAPSAISWMNKNYFWEMSIKIDPTKGAKYIEGVLLKVLDGYENSRVSGQKQVRVNINVDANR
jgi:primosomal protein N' (replication factor Y)